MNQPLSKVVLRPFVEQPMQIYGPFRVSAPQTASNIQQTEAQKPVSSDSQRISDPVDQLDLTNSVAATNRMDETSSVAGGGDIRIDRVAEIRRQIAEGTYETPEKLDVALNRMLDQFA